MPCATRSRTSFPRSRCRCWSPGAAANPSCRPAWAQTATQLLPLGELAVLLGPHNANYGAADHLGELVRVFLDRRAQAHGGQAN